MLLLLSFFVSCSTVHVQFTNKCPKKKLQTNILQAIVGFHVCAFPLDIGLWILAMFIPRVKYVCWFNLFFLSADVPSRLFSDRTGRRDLFLNCATHFFTVTNKAKLLTIFTFLVELPWLVIWHGTGNSSWWSTGAT